MCLFKISSVLSRLDQRCHSWGLPTLRTCITWLPHLWRDLPCPKHWMPVLPDTRLHLPRVDFLGALAWVEVQRYLLFGCLRSQLLTWWWFSPHQHSLSVLGISSIRDTNSRSCTKPYSLCFSVFQVFLQGMQIVPRHFAVDRSTSSWTYC